MRRSILALGAVPFAAAVLFPVGTHGSPATEAAPAVPLAGSTLTFEKVEVSTCPPLCHPLPDLWKAQYQIATWSPPWGQATYQYFLPPTIPPEGSTVTLTLTVKANPGARFAAAFGLSGDIGIENGPAEVSALAESGQAAGAEKKVKLVPRRYANGAAVQIVVGLLDGPRVTYTYRASNPPTVGCPRQRSLASAGAACLKSFRFRARAFHPDNIRAPTGRLTEWRVFASSLGSRVFLDYYERETPRDKLLTRGADLDLDVEDTHLVVSGPTKVLKLEVVVREVKRSPLYVHLLRCREGTRGSVVLVDDQRLMPGGDPDQRQTRDKVIVNLPKCSYVSHTYTNADSHSHEPFIGGPGAFSGRGGGQLAEARITTTG